MARSDPYHQFNFLVNLGVRDPQQPLGGFSDVSGLTTELVVSEYRNGNAKENHVDKVSGLHKVGDVTLKRGIVNSLELLLGLFDIGLRSIEKPPPGTG